MEKLEIVKQIESNIERLSKKDFGIYFFTMDTKGTPTAGVANVYEHVKVLNELGYRAYILHEKNDYSSVSSWLGEEYGNLPHLSIERNELKVSGVDVVIIPEIFGNVLEQIKGLPCRKMIMCQAYDYIFEMLEPGKTWIDYKVRDVITTSETQKEYIQNLFANQFMEVGSTSISIPDYFKKSEEPKKPIVTIYTRDQRDTLKIFKAFYIKYPHLKWVSFRDLRGMSREKFAENLSESCVSVWVDDVSGFGTFPLESMRCGVPVIGKVPNMVPEWMTDRNGMWTNNVNNIVDILGNYIQAWLEDLEPQELYTEMDETNTKYKPEEQKEIIKNYFDNLTNKMVIEFEKSLEQYDLTGITETKTEETNG
jgi:hypothetical protein